MRKLPFLVPVLLAAGACLPAQQRGAGSCLLAVSGHTQDGAAQHREPRWVRLARAGADTGTAQVGLYGSTTVPGHWWRISPDSVGVEAWDQFDAVRLRFDESRDTITGTVEIRTDADIGPRQVPVEPWIAVRGTCPPREH